MRMRWCSKWFAYSFVWGVSDCELTIKLRGTWTQHLPQFSKPAFTFRTFTSARTCAKPLQAFLPYLCSLPNSDCLAGSSNSKICPLNVKSCFVSRKHKLSCITNQSYSLPPLLIRLFMTSAAHPRSKLCRLQRQSIYRSSNIELPAWGTSRSALLTLAKMSSFRVLLTGHLFYALL